MDAEGATGAPEIGSEMARSWRDVHDDLTRRPADSLTGVELDLLADALFWLDRLGDSIDARRAAYRRHADAGDDAAAARTAWRIFYEHFLVGESAVATGWLERCRAHVTDDRAPAAGWLQIACSDVAAREGDTGAALARAEAATAIARTHRDRNLAAMALQALGRARIACGDRAGGLRLLDEAMIAVTNGELDPLFTGWVYCNVVSTCFQLADLARAGQWSRAAMRWCDGLDEGRMYPGLCRVYHVELECLRGAWPDAELRAREACAQLMAFDARYAGEAQYLVGELCRLRGDLDDADEAYARANELGRVPQPGLALALAARGRRGDAATMLETVLPTTTAPLPRARLLAELVDLEIARGDRARARLLADELACLADELDSAMVGALADGASGRLRDADGDHRDGYERLQRAVRQLSELGIPYEAARLRLAASRAAARSGDLQTAQLEGRTALASFEHLGARVDRARATAWLADVESGRVAGPGRTDETPLTDREVEVLRLIAGGSTNRQIAAELHVSPHTVGRHLSNIFTKIDVNTRAAATAYAYEHDLVRTAAET